MTAPRTAPQPASAAAPRSRRPLLGSPALQPEDDQDLWLVSYADMMTLLFAVFVIVVAIVGIAPPAPPSAATNVTPIPSTWQLLLTIRANETKESQDAAREVAAAPGVTLAPGQVVVDGPDVVRTRWQNYLQQLGLEKIVNVAVADSRINLVVHDEILFASGRAAIGRDGASVLQRLAALFAMVPGAVTIEGHTDSVPVRAGAFASNWDLSGARAAAVAEGLVYFGLPETRLRIVGYGDTRPVADNVTPDGRAANRRVVFVVESERSIPSGQ
jgi:chemotaxis protein MotB